MKKQLWKTALAKRAMAKKSEFKERIITRLEYKKKQVVENLKMKYSFLVKNATDKIKERYDIKLARALSKAEKQYERRKNRQIKVKVYKKEVKLVVPKATWKSKAFKEVCKFAKLCRADSKWMVTQVDTGKLVHRSECVGGHIYPKGNFPHMAFLVNNIRPISMRWNKKQLDNIANWIDNTPLAEEDKESLKAFSKNEFAKNKLRDSQYYQEMFELYKSKNEKEIEYLGEYYEKKSWQTEWDEYNEITLSDNDSNETATRDFPHTDPMTDETASSS